MSPDGAYRLEDLLAMLPEDVLSSLAQELECRDTIAEVRRTILGRKAELETCLSEMDNEQFEALYQLAASVPPLIPEEGSVEPALEQLFSKHWVFALELQQETRLYLPLELQMAVNNRRGLFDPDLRILLMSLDGDALSRLEDVYVSPEAEELEDSDDEFTDDLERICRLAEHMESPATLRELYQSLSPTAQEILGWTCEHGGPLGLAEVEVLASEAAQFHSEKGGAAIRQLTRFGLLLPEELDQAGDVLVVPRSLRRIILSVVDNILTGQAHAHYETLLAAGHLSFPDEGPHGWGGDALQAFRELTINWVSGRVEELMVEFGVAVGTQMIDPNSRRPGAFASLLLDLSGETAFSRQALRLWLALVDDPWTMGLIDAIGGDSERLIEYFSHVEPTGPNGDSDAWFGHLFLMRAQLLLTLSLLPPGKWFPMKQLGMLFHRLMARSTIAYLSHQALSKQFPYEALPDYGVVTARSDRAESIEGWIKNWLSEFVSTIGAAEIDRSGWFFRVHPDAFCVFRDSDLWFRTVWDDLAPIVGDDLDIWMPIPNDPGPRVIGVAEFWTTGQVRIAVARNCHFADLMRLAQWAIPTQEPSGHGFEFTRETVAAAQEKGLDIEEFLLWLASRLRSDVPASIRSLFPQSSSIVDRSVEERKTAAHERVGELLDSLESWGASPPSRLLEEIRCWGGIAIVPIRDRLADLIEHERQEDPLVQHLCVLLGELGAESSAALLIKLLQITGSEVINHAAAAALMRIGRPCLSDLIQLLRSGESSSRELKLLVAMTLTGMATLHPDTYHRAGEALVWIIENSAFDADLQTRLTLELCRMGHEKSESIIEELQANDSWVSQDWRPEDALWLVRVSPCVWGSLLFSTPLSMLYLVSDEADELASESGVRDLLQNAGLSTESVLYGQHRPERKK